MHREGLKGLKQQWLVIDAHISGKPRNKRSVGSELAAHVFWVIIL